jgi:hypothetical protein
MENIQYPDMAGKKEMIFKKSTQLAKFIPLFALVWSKIICIGGRKAI